MSLVHYGFSREEAMWMPITEMQDYIQLINNQVEEENEAQKNNTPHEKTDTPTFNDVFKGLKPGL